MKTTGQDLFVRALELPESERDAFLHEACGGDAELHLEVQRLLVDAVRADARFDGTDGETRVGVAGAGDPSAGSEKEGDQIGPYILRQQIGEGGFGVVWMAEQRVPISRMVALKVVKAGMDTKQVLARFEAERQALAMMDHPNIARVLDAGATDKSRPFFVMELVKGIPITDYCDEAGLGTNERLALFGDVCAAIQHAHQKGIIHRDIKPSNVMVTLHGDKPVVKVIDFGIAKATQGKLTDQTLFTRFEQFLGTPVYMSPEQAALSGLDIDTRSDIYALGILLYELLTGKPPFDAKTLISAGYDEMRRIIREVEPPKPSLRLSTVIGEERTMIAKARNVEPDKLSRLVEPDLDWIVMKAIDKDRTRRYDTANGLALDIQRHLKDEVITARPPTAGYLLGKLIRRNKLAFATAAAVAVALILGIVGTTFGLLRAEKQRRAAEAAQQLAEHRFNAARQFVDDVFQKVAPEFRDLIGASKASENLAQISSAFLGTLGEANHGDDAYLSTLALLYRNLSESLGGIYSANSLGDYETALKAANQSLAISRELMARHPMDIEMVHNVMLEEPQVGTLLGIMGRHDEAVAMMRQCVEHAEQCLKAKPNDAAAIRGVRFAHAHLGSALAGQGHFEEAFAQQLLPYSKEWLARPVAKSSEYWDDKWSCVSHWVAGRYLIELGRPAEALSHLEKALEWNKISSGEEPNNARWPRDWSDMNCDIGRAQVALGHFDEAGKIFQQAIERLKPLIGRDPANGLSQTLLLKLLFNQAKGLAKHAGLETDSPEQQAKLWGDTLDVLAQCQQQLNTAQMQLGKNSLKDWPKDIDQSRKEAQLALSKLTAHE